MLARRLAKKKAKAKMAEAQPTNLPATVDPNAAAERRKAPADPTASLTWGEYLPREIREAAATAEILVRSGWFDDAESVSQALTKILAGQEIGLSPIASMTNVYVIETKKGKRLAFHYSVLLSRVESSNRYAYRVAEWSNDVCRVEFFEVTGTERESLGVSEWTLDDAKRAGTGAFGTLAKFPKAMLLSKAVAQGVRAFCPSVMNGRTAYVPEDFFGEEIESKPEGSSAEVVALEGRRRPKRKAEAAEPVEAEVEKAEEPAEIEPESDEVVEGDLAAANVVELAEEAEIVEDEEAEEDESEPTADGIFRIESTTFLSRGKWQVVYGGGEIALAFAKSIADVCKKAAKAKDLVRLVVVEGVVTEAEVA